MATELTPKQQLQAVKELLSDRTKWTAEALARNAAGRPLKNPSHPSAVCWCFEGALRKVNGLRSEDLGHGVHGLRVWTVANRVVYPRSIININDEEGYEAVMELIDATMREL